MRGTGKIDHRSVATKAVMGGLVFAAALLVAPVSSSATCYGTWTDYYETQACVEWVSTKVSCPGYPDQWDIGPGGNTNGTPYFVTEQVVCPCPGTGGGGGGGGPGETGESEGE